MKNKSALILTLLCLNTALAKQKYYKWTDEHGVTHYTTEKPENNQTHEVNVNTKQPKVSRPAAKVESQDPDAKSYVEQRREKRQQAKDQAKNNKIKCDQAKQTIAKLKQQVRMSRVDTDTGETIYLEDNKRAEIIKQAQQQAKKYCK
jgi:hypothetical protein